jgi:hypothetical protein
MVPREIVRMNTNSGIILQFVFVARRSPLPC